MNIILCHGFTKSSISTVIFTCRSVLVPYYLSRVFVIVETEEGGIYNIHTSVKIQTRSEYLHKFDSLLTLKATITSIVNTLDKIFIARSVYENYVSNFYDDCHVEFYNLYFKNLSNSALMNWDILPSSLSGELLWTNLLIKKSQKKINHQKKSIIILTYITSQRVLNHSFCGSCFWVFLVLRPKIFHKSKVIHYCNQCNKTVIFGFCKNSNDIYPSSFYQICCALSC